MADPTIVVVTSDVGASLGLKAVLGLTGWRVQDVPTARMAAQAMRGSVPDVVVVDHSLPDADGLTVVGDVQRIARGRDVVVAALVENIKREDAMAYVKAGVKLFLTKPLDLAEASAKLAARVDGAEALKPLPYHSDPLAKPVVVVCSPSLNARDTVIQAVSDECDVVHFDGSVGLDAATHRAGCLLVDEGMPGGLDALAAMEAIFGKAPAFAIVSRGAEVPEGYAAPLVKPLRGSSVQKAVRAATDRRLVALTPLPTGLVVRLRESWHQLPNDRVEDLVQQIEGFSRVCPETGRSWICITGPYVGAREQLSRLRPILAAAGGRNLKVGIVTSQPNPVRVAHDLRLHPSLVHQSTADFIKTVQELV